MSVDVVALLLVLAIAPAITLFSILYTLTSPWYRSMAGWALWWSSSGLALLVDISLVYQWLGDNYALRDVVRLSVFTWILIGAWLKLIALLREKWRARHGKVDRFASVDE